MLPNWIVDQPAGEAVAPPSIGRRTATRFIDRSLRELRHTVQYELQTEHLARLPGFLQSIEPGFKLLIMIAFIALASFNHNMAVMAIMWLISLMLISLSRLPVLRTQILIWGTMPLITLLISLPAALNLLIAGHELLVIYDSGQSAIMFWHWTLPGKIYFSQEGVLAAIRLALRTGLSISAAIMMTMTTPAARLFNSLAVLRVPPYFVMIVEMCYRYMAVLINTSIEIFEARKVRTVGRISPSDGRALFGSSLAALFIRSMRLTEEVYQSMTARGYTGEIQSGLKAPGQSRDWYFLIISLLAIMLLYAGGRIFELKNIFF